MLEINVTCLLDDVDPSEISGSRAERGDNAGQETWQNAIDATAEAPLLKPQERDYARAFFGTFGAWDDDEIEAWTDNELDALVLQYAAGDLRELQSCAPGDGIGNIDWTEAEKLASEGTVSGSVYPVGADLYVMLSN